MKSLLLTIILLGFGSGFYREGDRSGVRAVLATRQNLAIHDKAALANNDIRRTRTSNKTLEALSSKVFPGEQNESWGTSDNR